MKNTKLIAVFVFLAFSFAYCGSVSAGNKDSDHDCVYDEMDKCPGTPINISVDDDGCPPDTDGDGVYDHKDKCPDTPAGAPVDKQGCPLDTDGDGVYDHKDKCPGTPAGVPVDENGCPLDTDGDGVYDHKDKCPGTPAGVKVDSVGCIIPVIKEKISIELNVEFDTDKFDVRTMYHNELQEFADFLIKYPSTTAVIEGHTDSRASDEHNLTLSSNRANAIRTYLIENMGIAPDRLKAKGFGESVPRADNDTKEGMQRNRRVIAVVSEMVIKK